MNVYHWFNFSFVGLKNYKDALFVFDSGFLAALLRTILWTVLNMVLQLVIAFVLASLLNIQDFKGRRVYKTLLMIPWAMPGYVSILLWKTGIFNSQFGLLNQWMQKLGLATVRWLANEVSAFLCCTVVNLWLPVVSKVDCPKQGDDTMNFEAIQHIPMSQQAHGIDPNHVVFRLRAGRDDLKHCTLFYADRACRLTPVIFSSVEMQVEAQDEWFDYFQVILESPYKRICYYFELDDGTQKLLYYGDFFTDHRVDDRSEYYQLPFNHPADIAAPPAWAQDAVVYNIFPDSFATGRRFISGKSSEKEWNGQITRGKLGGTLRGVIENLDYIQELGATCIYMNPIFAAGEYHKYDLLDYHHIDPCFGTDEDFRQLVNDCHARGMRVIIDGVFNHVGWNFFAFDDVVRNGENSKYKNWFYHLQFPVERPEDPETYPTYECFGYERMMPKTNTCNPEVQEYFCEVGRYWVREFDIDGWRLDVASEINDGFWRAFRQAVKEEKAECILIGEVWETAQHWLNGDIFDSTMNYDFRKHCRRFFAEQSIDAAEFDARVTNMRMRYKLPVLYAQLNLLDSHDVSRFYSLCEKDPARMQLAVLFQMTFTGIPSVFYGDERGIYGLQEAEYRHEMTWSQEPPALADFYKKAMHLRTEHPALCRGSYHTVKAEKENGLYGYERTDAKEKITVFLNNQSTAVDISPMNGKILWQQGYEEKNNSLAPMGFAVFTQEV